MDILWEEITAGLPNAGESERILIRLIAAMVLGGVVGLERERVGKAAGMRTHILVTMGTALFVIACTSIDMGLDGLSRVIQGIATGIGFIGTGTILKMRDKLEIHGLTTAAGLFLTAAVGVAVGVGRIGLGIVASVLAWIVLSLLRYVERLVSVNKGEAHDASERSGPSSKT